LFFVRYVREVAKSSRFQRHISMSICLHVRLSARAEEFIPQDGFCQILYFGVVPISVEQIEVWLKFDKIRRHLMKTVMTTLITNITVGYFDNNRY